jgi:multicomponent Na+:H+ antiporter subunit C
MDLSLSIVVGFLYAAGLYLMMRRSIVKLLIGLAILGNAANLLIFTAGRPVRGVPPLAPEGAQQVTMASDPLPQALILTAIVISFGVLAFAIVLVQQAYKVTRTDDLDQMKATES